MFQRKTYSLSDTQIKKSHFNVLTVLF